MAERLQKIRERDAAAPLVNGEGQEPARCACCGGRDMHKAPCRQYERELLDGLEHAAALLGTAKADRHWLLAQLDNLATAVRLAREVLDRNGHYPYDVAQLDKALAALHAPTTEKGAPQSE